MASLTSPSNGYVSRYLLWHVEPWGHDATWAHSGLCSGDVAIGMGGMRKLYRCKALVEAERMRLLKQAPNTKFFC